MKSGALIALLLFAASAHAGQAPRNYAQQRESLEHTLCSDKALSCSYVRALFEEDDFALPTPPPPTSPLPTAPHKRERNPYMTERFGLLTPESLERCRKFVMDHQPAFDSALAAYGVPKEIICGHLRIETDFGIATSLTPHPLGTAPAFNRLVLLYAANSHRRKFAVEQLKYLIAEAESNHWDLLTMPGSFTGAIGLLQFEPSNFYLAVDGDGDGVVDLFSPADAIMSLAHYLSAHGWSADASRQERAIYSYYGKDPHRYYMKAVLTYAAVEKVYLMGHPLSRPDVEPQDTVPQQLEEPGEDNP